MFLTADSVFPVLPFFELGSYCSNHICSTMLEWMCVRGPGLLLSKSLDCEEPRIDLNEETAFFQESQMLK